MTDAIAIKGIREGLLVTLSDGETWPVTSQGLLARIDDATDFFRGAKLALAIGSRPLHGAGPGPPRHDFAERSVSARAGASGLPLTGDPGPARIKDGQIVAERWSGRGK